MARELPFHAKQCVFQYATTALASVATDDTLVGQFTGTDFTGSIKDISITPPTSEASQENFLGSDSNGHQNSRFNTGAFTAAEISGTLVVEETEIFEQFLGGSAITTDTDASDHTRYQFGNESRVIGALLATLDNGANEVSYLLNGLYIEEVGDVTFTDTDGHWEMEFQGKCLPADFYYEVGPTTSTV